MATSISPSLTVLKDEELTKVRRAIGAPKPRPYPSKRSTSSLWPPRTLPDGLYRDVVRARYKAQYFYYFVATTYNFCIVLQLLLGAVLTALAAAITKHPVATTVLAAANTVNAGIVALLHNSGLPDRIRNDWNTYAKVELSLVELLSSGVIQLEIPAKGDLVANVVAYCYALYTNANITVQKNKPASYVGSPANNENALAY